MRPPAGSSFAARRDTKQRPNERPDRTVMTFKPLVAITMGDPSGIGPEVVSKALMRPGIYERMRPFVIGTVSDMEAANRLTGSHRPASFPSVRWPKLPAPRAWSRS